MSLAYWLPLVAGGVLTLPAAPAARAQTLRPAEARDHLGQTATVCGSVSSTRYDSLGLVQPTLFELDGERTFVVQILGIDRRNFPTPPEVAYAGRQICVRGLILSYGRAAQIMVAAPRAIQIRRAPTQDTERRVNQLTAFLPHPFGQWEAVGTETLVTGRGAGAGVRRTYGGPSPGGAGDQWVEVEFALVATAPGIEAQHILVRAMIERGDDQLVTLKGVKCIETLDLNDEGKLLQCLPGDSVLVTISGDRSAGAVLRDFANRIDFAGLQAMFRVGPPSARTIPR